MATLLQQSENLKKLNESVIEQQLFKAIREAEVVILDANKEQLSKGENYLGGEVGRYSPYTQGFADAKETFTNVPKKEGSLYNFDWTGDFLKGFKLGINGNEATITSNVLGDDSKLNFLLNNNLFGLNDENLKKIIQSEILPFIHSFARKTLNI